MILKGEIKGGTKRKSIKGHHLNIRKEMAQPLPQGWELKHDPQGKPYFIDHINKKTTYSDPRVQTHVAPIVQPQPVVTNNLPQGWEQRTDPSGRSFFIDHINRRTTYDDPRNHALPVAPPTSMMSNLNIASQSQRPLPTGWEMRHDPAGRAYFIDHTTKKSTYEDPRSQAPIAPTPQTAAAAPMGLPAGWEMKVDASGRPYYVDHLNRKTTYDDPRKSPQVLGRGSLPVMERPPQPVSPGPNYKPLAPSHSFETPDRIQEPSPEASLTSNSHPVNTSPPTSSSTDAPIPTTSSKSFIAPPRPKPTYLAGNSGNSSEPAGTVPGNSGNRGPPPGVPRRPDPSRAPLPGRPSMGARGPPPLTPRPTPENAPTAPTTPTRPPMGTPPPLTPRPQNPPTKPAVPAVRPAAAPISNAPVNLPEIDETNSYIPIDPDTIKQGWALKQGARVKNWKRRFFILKESSLSYYELPPTVAKSATPKGTIHLTGACIATIGAKIEDAPEGGFALVLCIPKTRDFNLILDTQEDAKAWYDTLRSVLEKLPKGKDAKTKKAPLGVFGMSLIEVMDRQRASGIVCDCPLIMDAAINYLNNEGFKLKSS
eukprot:TRINITY_DN3546_c0_g1_i3.p1 TRINITY_DN3546_c0_g1~~TRINITY_DN3546_c0_g1_i3.p1  ORF type:complete len:594 (-),score=150.30 TRINITY_DN3546_c0_g1_i3:531-2312(-)